MTGAEVRAWRIAHGYTQVAMAHLCGLKLGTLRDIEQGRGETSPLLPVLGVLIKSFDLHATEYERYVRLCDVIGLKP